MISKHKYIKKEKTNQKFQVITLKDLALAFPIPRIRVAFSTVIFMVEVIMW